VWVGGPDCIAELFADGQPDNWADWQPNHIADIVANLSTHNWPDGFANVESHTFADEITDNQPCCQYHFEPDSATHHCSHCQPYLGADPVQHRLR